MFCRFGFHADGAIRLVDAQIRGDLDMTGAQLSKPGQTVLLAHRLRVDGGLRFGDGFRADGEISLRGARIGGQVSFEGAQLTNPGLTALDAGRLTADGESGLRETDSVLTARSSSTARASAGKCHSKARS